jgi:hypothetical protein
VGTLKVVTSTFHGKPDKSRVECERRTTGTPVLAACDRLWDGVGTGRSGCVVGVVGVC